MTAHTIAITNIDASERLRPLDPDTVAGYAAIAEQRAAEGKSPLIQPIIVRPAGGESYKLTAGGHRLACLKEIGVESLTIGVDVVIKEEDDASAFESELFENLANAGLKALDHAIFLAEAKKIADSKRGETRGRKGSKVAQLQDDKKVAETAIISSARFTKAAAERIGLSERQIYEAVRIANGLDAATVAEIRGTVVEDNLNELKQLTEIPLEKRRSAAAAIKRGEAKRVAEARVAVGLDRPKVDDPQARILAQLVDLWGKASKETRANFLESAGLIEAKKGKAA